MQAQQVADASANALWAIFKGATFQGHLSPLQPLPAAGSSDAGHEHQRYHGAAETATQLAQKLPVPEAVLFLAESLLRKTCLSSPCFSPENFIYLFSRCCISDEYQVTEEEERVY